MEFQQLYSHIYIPVVFTWIVLAEYSSQVHKVVRDLITQENYYEITGNLCCHKTVTINIIIIISTIKILVVGYRPFIFKNIVT